jgi:hypothetical protein
MRNKYFILILLFGLLANTKTISQINCNRTSPCCRTIFTLSEIEVASCGITNIKI